MSTNQGLTPAERRVLRCAIDSPDQNYQPSAEAKAIADALYARGLLAPRPGWPDS